LDEELLRERKDSRFASTLRIEFNVDAPEREPVTKESESDQDENGSIGRSIGLQIVRHYM